MKSLSESALLSDTYVIWFRRDLRVSDHAALTAACLAATTQNKRLLALAVNEKGAFCPTEGASKERFSKTGHHSYPQATHSHQWWLKSLSLLQKSLKALHIPLLYIPEGTEEAFSALKKFINVSACFYHEPSEPHLIEQDRLHIEKLGLTRHRFPANLLFTPGEILKSNQEPYLIFTAFWKRCLEVLDSEAPLSAPAPLLRDNALEVPVGLQRYCQIFQPPPAAWQSFWNIGEVPAHQALDTFLTTQLATYEEARNFPKLHATSRLSAHLHFGEITPRQIFYAARSLPHAAGFLRELGWREFAAHTLHFFPELPFEALYKKMLHFPCRHDLENLKAWQTGQTGYPIVDAGMRELLAHGTMHNRVRMITASFLTKHLLLPWQIGAHWFWQQLVDADLASNSLNWQWVAGSGIDPQPFFRIFNPILQGQKFDKEGDYIRTFVPELANLPASYIHTPWKADSLTLHKADIKLGETYPLPIVEHTQARDRALTAYRNHYEVK